MATSTLNQVLSDLYTDKITIKDACKILGKTREEVWTLLDSFEYFPTSKDVITACEIEKNSMRLIEHEALKLNMMNDPELIPRILSPFMGVSYYPIKNIKDLSDLPLSKAYRSEIPNNIVSYEKNELKIMIEVGCGA